MRFLRCFSQCSLCTVSILVTVPSESTVVFRGIRTFQLQLCCTDKAAGAVLAHGCHKNTSWKRSTLVRRPRLIGGMWLESKY